MIENYKKIQFDRHKNPGLEIDIFPLEEIFQRRDLDHDPKELHRVHFYILILITTGETKHTVDFKEYSLKKGSVLTIRKDQVHKFHNCSANGHLLIFTEEFALSYMDKSSSDKISALFNELFFYQQSELNPAELKEFEILIVQIKNEFDKVADEHTSSILRNLLQVIISRLNRKRRSDYTTLQNKKYIPQFLEFQQAVEKSCTHSRSVSYYANQLNITTRTLNNITHQIINKSAKSFIDEILILQIKRHLINSSLNIKEIAYSTGFDEPSNLFKFFKRHTNQTPETFRSTYSISS